MRATAAFALAAVALWPATANVAPASWHVVTTPAPGAAEAIGGYSAGCIQGAAALPRQGKGYRVARPERRRYFGHPRLVAYIQTLAAAVADKKLGRLWVDDLGQVRGGPAPSGHASHQTGLDVDLRYVLDLKASSEPESVVDLAAKKPNAKFTERVIALLTLAAGSPHVDRIFVNPVVKREMCDRAGADASVLRKLRPWWGHHDHFHVRLACPENSTDCTPQPSLSPGDDCDALDWWFAPTSEAERDKKRGTYQSKVGASPELPPRCRDVLEAGAAGHGKPAAR